MTGVQSSTKPSGNLLAIDVHEDDKQYTVTTELPGVKPENINVRQDGDYLLIEADIPEETTEKQDDNKRWLVRERRSGHFSRRIRLPQNVDFDKAEANYHDGVLTLTLAEGRKRAAAPDSGQDRTAMAIGVSNTVVGIPTAATSIELRRLAMLPKPAPKRKLTASQ